MSKERMGRYGGAKSAFLRLLAPRRFFRFRPRFPITSSSSHGGAEGADDEIETPKGQTSHAWCGAQEDQNPAGTAEREGRRQGETFQGEAGSSKGAAFSAGQVGTRRATAAVPQAGAASAASSAGTKPEGAA